MIATKRAFLMASAMAASIGGFAPTTSAQQFDAEYYVQQKRFGEQWKAQDSQVRAKLAALERKFGKKPNIITSWRTTSGTPNSAVTAEAFAALPHRISTKWRARVCDSSPTIPNRLAQQHASP